MTRRGSLAVGVTVAALCLPFATAAQAATVVASWQMNDTGTVMTDSSGNGITGTLKNVKTGGGVFTFQGKPSVVSVKNNTLLNPGTGIFTVTARIKFATVPSQAVGDYDLVRKGLAGTSGGHWKMEISPSGKGYCLFHGSSGKLIVTAGPNLANNAWHTVSCQRSGTTLRLTVDGTSYSKSGATGNIANTSTAFVGAKNLSGGDQFTGAMDFATISRG